MMNKQEVIEKIEACKSPFNSEDDTIFNYGLGKALSIIKQLDEPEKPVLSKEEAEWLEHLKSIGNFTHCLYVITRQGWGCDFEFRSHGKKYKLSCASENDGDENELTKNRLVNALIYGYEVEKEKLYTAKLKSTGEYLHYDKDYRETCHQRVPDDVTQKCEGYHFTEDDLIKYYALENEAYDVKEVKR